MDAGLEARHTRMYALLRWRTPIINISEYLEHLASDNHADIHKYNTLYTIRIIGIFKIINERFAKLPNRKRHEPFYVKEVKSQRKTLLCMKVMFTYNPTMGGA